MTHRASPRRRSALLVVAGVVLLVLLGGAVSLWLSGPADSGNSSSTTVPVAEPLPPETTDAPTTSVAPSTSTAPTTTEPPVAGYETSVFLVQDPENSFTGDPALIAFLTVVAGPEGSPVELLALRLLSDPELVPPAPGFYSAVPEDVEMISVAREEETLLVEVNEAFRRGAGGLLADMTMLNQLVYTATWGSEVDLVLFLIDGQPIVDFGTDGLDISEGVTRETFRDSLNSVLVTEPVILAGDGLPVVAGVANVFEATVSIEILDADGEVRYQDFTTATCGTGCWGEYSFSLDTPALGSDALIRVFWNSPNDGARSDVVYIPVTDGLVWDLVG